MPLARLRLPSALALLAVVILCGSSDTAASPSLSGWVKIGLRGGRCAHGQPFSFWARLGSPSKLLVYFQDGGGCWSYDTCLAGSGYYQDRLRAPDEPSLPEEGVFDFKNPSNPLRGWSAIYVPSCTGDVHWGKNVQRYSDGQGHSLTIHHFGFVNGAGALAWAYRRFPTPAKVLVAGCSAGSVGSAVFAPYVIHHYPKAVVDQVGDSLAFVFPRPANVLDGWRSDRTIPRWLSQVRGLNYKSLRMADYYVALARSYPDYQFTQIDYSADAVQARFFAALGGRRSDFPQALKASLASIETRALNFHSFVIAGESHCTLPYDRVYSTNVGGVALSSWVAAVADGRPVPSVG